MLALEAWDGGLATLVSIGSGMINVPATVWGARVKATRERTRAVSATGSKVHVEAVLGYSFQR